MQLSQTERERLSAILEQYDHHPKVQEMREFIQHGDVTTYQHCKNVVVVSCWINHRFHLGADETTLAVGAFLHDFYLYDWHKRSSFRGLRRLFEIEVPEIHDGLINIRAVARIPGERAKIAVESYDDRIDPVGACVGVKGSRIHGIVRELRNENIDVINYTANPTLFIQRALSPAKISSIRIDEEEKKAEVFLKPDQVSLAIGKGGLNIKLASMLTGYVIDVYRDTDDAYEEDIYLDEFKDEIEEWIIDALKDMGCVTAKAVLNTSREDLINKADLEEETVDNVLAILRAEFEDEPEAQQPAADNEAKSETPEADAPQA